VSGQNGGAGRSSESPFQMALENLAATESGLGLVYSALTLLAAHYELDDAVLVLENYRDSARTQIFRLHGKVIDSGFVMRFGDVPGLYSTPQTVSPEDTEALMRASERALSSRKARITADQESNELAPSPSVRQSWRARSLDPSAAPAERVAQSRRVFVSGVLVIVDLANLVMTVTGTHGPVRFTLGLTLGLFIPGWSIVGFLNLRNAALEFALSMGSSLAILLIAAQTMTLINFWHLGAFEDFVCCVCLIPLARLSNQFQRTNRLR
jgi:hypothetical protein